MRSAPKPDRGSQGAHALQPVTATPAPSGAPPPVPESASNPSDERAHGAARVSMRSWTLRFADDLEREFIEEYFGRTLSQVRMALVLGASLYAVFAILDLWIAPRHWQELWVIRAVAVPVILAPLALSYTRHYRRWRDYALTTAIMLAALGIVVMTSIIPAPGSYLYYAGLVLVVTYAFTLVRLPVTYSSTIAAFTIVAYVLVATVFGETAPVLVVNNLFFLFAAAIIGFSANYSMERYARTNFLQRRVIAERTAELERANALLLVKNQMLAESRAETIRSAHRSELIFSALSDALPGTVLDDKYRIEEKLGAGGFGTVYRGVHLFLHHPVAIKVFRPAIGGSALESLDRFRVEGISACRVSHPNAVTVLDFDVSAGSLAYLVMELLEGRSLADEIRAAGRLDVARAVRIALDVCNVLSEAHAAGIVHRDIKPSNVFLHRLKGEEQVKVIDFGLAKLAQSTTAADSPAVSVAGTLLGTVEYMSPERLEGHDYDGRADVYSLGVMLFEMLTGEVPFRSRDGGYWSVARMHAEQQPERPSRLDRRIPAELDALVLRALAKKPADRPDARALGTALRRLAS